MRGETVTQVPDDYGGSMTAYEMMDENILLTAEHVKRILKAHGVDDMSEFVADNGNFAVYGAFKVFAWLGY